VLTAWAVSESSRHQYENLSSGLAVIATKLSAQAETIGRAQHHHSRRTRWLNRVSVARASLRICRLIPIIWVNLAVRIDDITAQHSQPQTFSAEMICRQRLTVMPMGIGPCDAEQPPTSDPLRKWWMKPYGSTWRSLSSPRGIRRAEESCDVEAVVAEPRESARLGSSTAYHRLSGDIENW